MLVMLHCHAVHVHRSSHIIEVLSIMQLKEQLDDREVAQRLAHAQSFAKSGRATSELAFPPAPVVPEFKGTGLGSWMPAEPAVINVAS